MSGGKHFRMTREADRSATGTSFGMDPFASDGTAFAAIRSSNAYDAGRAFRFTIEQARELIEKLQANIDEATQIAEPDCSYVVDRHNRKWTSDQQFTELSRWRSQHTFNHYANITELVRAEGPVTPVTVTETKGAVIGA